MPNPAKLLLVESIDVQQIVQSLCEREYAGSRPFEISNKGSWTDLQSGISAEVKAPGRVALGIIVEASAKPKHRWRDIRHCVDRAVSAEEPWGLPARPSNDGTVVGGNEVRVGVWLMPDNKSAGAIEDFIEALIPATDPVWPLAKRYIDGIPEAGRRFPPNKSPRAKIDAWLAAREAIGGGDLDAAAELAIRLRAWLRKLFG